MLGFIAYPMLSVFYYSLQDYNLTKPWRNGFAGLDNFVDIFTEDPLFWDTLDFSAKWVVVEVGLQLCSAWRWRSSSTRPSSAAGSARALVFSPWAVSGVLTTAIWILLYNSQTGISRYLGGHGHRRVRHLRCWPSPTRSSGPRSSPNCGAACRSSRSCSSPTSSRVSKDLYEAA